jgi:hypothetical protein
MIERWKNDDGSETIMVMVDPPRPSLLQRIYGFVGKTILVLLFSLFPLYLLIYGIRGLSTGKLRMWSRVQGSHTLYGHEAVGWSWIMIGFAIGFIPFVFREYFASWLKWLIASAVAACFVIGIWRLIQGN